MPHANRIFLPGPARHSSIATGGIVFRRNCGESFGDAQRRMRPGVHPLHVGQQLRVAVQQFGLVAQSSVWAITKSPTLTLSPTTNCRIQSEPRHLLGSSSTVGDYLN